MAFYDIGDQPRFSVTFSTAAGAATDPTTVVAKVRSPDGGETSYTYGTDPEVVRDGVGVYHVDVRLTADGPWSVRFVGTGALVAAVENLITARASRFAQPL